jgi:Uncharacterized alpha/beta hydrolase domain (DUF2235)
MKRLVLCFDGTWEARPSHRLRRRGQYATNVERTHIAVEKQDGKGNSQITSYYRGIGSAAVRYWPGLTGQGISSTICDAYAFIADNFDLGCDELYLFGFSRGAYTARSLCGFMQWVGILKKAKLALLADAYKQYRLPLKKRDEQFQGDQLQSLKEREPTSFPVRFLGVWDTVGSVGLPVPGLGWFINHWWTDFHDVSLTENVQHAFQALAIHERRVPFKPEIWKSRHPGQTVEQAWFAGTHSDVGGGNADRGLSDIALLWMICQAEKLHLAFDRTYLANATDADVKCKIFNSSSGVWRPAPRRLREFGKGINECCDASVPLHVAQFALAKRRKKWREAEKAALLLGPCQTCVPHAALSTTATANRNMREQDIDARAREIERRIKSYPKSEPLKHRSPKE